ncbi:uncharacterized protein MELLADRAFT_112214 [Melampsora larici-populina 98AG31]|uniref:Secreted protein n=1 Tax=Melampsora larici-populina (strain 98AG31 / pathotype 3-4-7) TaxID=747676 RepID=F4S5R2_MELLP|nr:uncharacterized protein MELLADRAFT_112214 [Melampsora larici-populina 98AG31]EGF99943.1 hypothetical protein MELLADRAFT_112214 [Melampsora larici-populina 98AG31]
MSSNSIFLVIFHLLILQASPMDLDTSLSLGHNSISNANKSPTKVYQSSTSEEPNLELSLNPGKRIILEGHMNQEKNEESSSMDSPINSLVELDMRLTLPVNNLQDKPFTASHKRKKLGSLESQNIEKSWLGLGTPDGPLDMSTVGSTRHEKLPIGSIRNFGDQMLYRMSGKPYTYSVSNSIYPPQYHHTILEPKLTMVPFTPWTSKVVPSKETILLENVGRGSGKRTVEQTSIGSDIVSQRFKQQQRQVYQPTISESGYPKQYQTYRTFPSHPSFSIAESSDMPQRPHDLQLTTLKGNPDQGTQYQERKSQETLKLEHIWLKTIESLGNRLIDESPGLDVSTWLNVLRDDMKELWENDPIKIFRGYEIPYAITKSKERLSGTFLGCLKVLHQVKGPSNRTQDQIVELINDGWFLIQKLLNPWRISLSTSNAKIIPVRKVNKIAGMQPLVLFFYLARGGAAPIAIQYLWTFWKKWYRESSSTHKRFLATRDHFIHAIGTSLKQIGQSSIYHDDWLKDANMLPLDEEISHHDLLDQHCLQCLHLSRTSIDKTINQGDLLTLAVYVGRFEVQLLEHHEAVEEYFDELGEELQTKLYNIGSQKLKDFNPSINKLVGSMYRRITIPFLGSLQMLHGNDLTLKAKSKDPIISDGWRFLKTLIDQIKDINLMDLFESEHPITPNELHCPQNIYDLSKKMLKLGDTCNVLLSQIWELHTQWSQSSSFAIMPLDSKSFEENLRSYYARMHMRSHKLSNLGRGIYRD